MIEFARRMEKVRASDIRELLKLTDKPGMISFAGGLPAPEMFPVERLKAIGQKVLETSGAEALQYAAT
jgi:DNA-binding transcriptional MocR family regulator